MILLAARKCNFPLSLKQTIRISNLQAKIMNKCLLKFKKILPDTNNYNPNPMNYMKLFAKKLKMNDEMKEVCENLIERITRKGFCLG